VKNEWTLTSTPLCLYGIQKTLISCTCVFCCEERAWKLCTNHPENIFEYVFSYGSSHDKRVVYFKKYGQICFFRAEKTEVLSDVLQEADRKVESISKACGSTSKKMGTLSLGQDAAAREKRLVR
jgi:hypothetical protein